MNLLSEAVIVYTSEFERFITFISDVFANSPFFISADTAGTLGSRENEEYKEIIVQAGRTYEVLLMVESENSYIAWDFSLVQGKISMLILPYHRYEADQLCCLVSSFSGSAMFVPAGKLLYANGWKLQTCLG
ncbi:hypothetical protein F2Q70_00006961 [Brassica cretica]|uniref:Uncharacterized protein n=1 Tax=Brassica cretica TaxID=69181 RepID=A0A8S9LQN1_BRACR|nr:hypothetical protein F2Q70_00006961 [Brassica cretica]